MNSFSETLNHWGGNFLHVAWPMLWQSSALIVVVLAFEFLLRRRLRASIRYALWLVVLIKLILPPTLALPTSPAWWFHETPPLPVKISAPKFTVTYDQTPLLEMTSSPLSVFVPPPPVLTFSAWLLITSLVASMTLFLWLLLRWWQISRQVRRANISERLTVLAGEVQQRARMKFKSPTVKITANTMSPAVCGLFRPVILIPQSLAAEFSDDQLRAVLLHELIHLRRRDVWVNFLQSLLQIVYWWHPLVWVANARIRRVREEAVDDAVMLTLGGTAEIYAPTLLEVAKLALNRPLASLGLVGILESRSALRQRIERLVNFNAPRKAGLTLVSFLGILVFSAVAVPMGEGPTPINPAFSNADVNLSQTNSLASVKKTHHSGPIYPSWETNHLTVRPTSMIQDRKEIIDDLNRIRFENVSYDHEWLGNVIGGLENIIPYHDLENKGIAIMMDQTQLPGEAPGQGAVYITIRQPLASVTLGDLLDAIIKGADKPIKYSIENYAIVFSRHEQTELPLFIRTFKLDTNVFIPNLQRIGWPVGGGATNISLAARNYFTQLGVNLASPKGKVVFWNDRLESLYVKATEDDLEIIERAILILNTRTSVALQNKSVPGILSDSNFLAALHMLQQRNGIEKLNEPEVVHMKNPLHHANAMDPSVESALLEKLARTNPVSVVGVVDAKTTATISPLFARSGLTDVVDTTTATVGADHLTRTYRLNYPTNEAALKQLFLAAGVQMPPTVFFYRNSNGILFASGTKDQLALIYRVVLQLNNFSPRDSEYRINQFINEPVAKTDGHLVATNLFTRAFKIDPRVFYSALQSMGQMPEGETNIVTAAKNFFATLGVDLESPEGKAVFYNDRLSFLFVKATRDDLDTIERAIQALNQVPPQVHIKARFVEVPEKVFQDLAPDLFPNAAMKSGTNGWHALLTNQKFQVIRNQLLSLGTSQGEELAEPEAVLTSGRQVQMRATELITVVTNMALQIPQTEMVEVGPMLDVIPYVLADGDTINLTAIASLTDFLGYTESTNRMVGSTKGKKVDLPAVLPKFQVQRAVITSNLGDSQTLVLGNFQQHHFDGNKETNGKASSQVKELLVFITATIVDPAGNRVHADNELPFAKIEVPPQPPQN